MLVESIEIKTKKKDAVKYLLDKMPLMSKIIQFNSMAKDIHIEYVEFKILKYEVTSKGKYEKFFRYETKKYNLTMLVNTYNGYSESIDNIPDTAKRYIAKSCIKKTKIPDEDIIDGVKSQIIYFIGEKSKQDNIDKMNVQNIKIKEVKSIYKPYWVAQFKGKSIFIDA